MFRESAGQPLYGVGRRSDGRAGHHLGIGPSGKGPYDTHNIQLGAYAYMLEEIALGEPITLFMTLTLFFFVRT